MGDILSQPAKASDSVVLSPEEKANLVKVQNFLFDTFYAENLRDTPLKPLPVAINEKMNEIKKIYLEAHSELAKGKKLFEEAMNEEEKAKFERILANSGEDASFLLEIAKNKFAEDKFEEASLMYHFLLKSDWTCSVAWVGLALCQLQLELFEEAFITFDFGLTLSSNAPLVVEYAADLFSTCGNNDRAKEILQTAIDQLNEQGKQSSDEAIRLTELLAKIG